MIKKILPVFLFSALLFADPLNSSLEVGSSVSHYYDSRSVFTNPSALSYQTLLNHARLTSSFEYAVSENMPNDYAFSIAYGMLGFGVEKLSSLMDPYLRFSFAGGVPIGRSIFLGGRYSLTSSENDNFKNISSLDLGFQIRASRYFSFGFMANKLNRPSTNQIQTPIQLVAGITLKPFSRLLIQADLESAGEEFGKSMGYQANAQLEIFDGFSVSGGYHHLYQYQMGIRLNLSRLVLFSTAQPASNEKKYIFGVQTLPAPERTASFITQTLQLKVDNTLTDEGRDASLFSDGNPSLLELIEKMKRVESDASIKNITIEIQNFPLGLASAEELTASILKLKNAGKKVTAVIGNADTKTYLIASAASEIVMDPDGELKILGPRAEHFYAKGLLDKLGVEAQFLAKGEYKSFPEMFTRKDSSDASKRATQDQLLKMEEEVLTLLAATRKTSKSTWQEILKTAILTAKDAKKFGLVDSIEKRGIALEKLKDVSLISHGNAYYRKQLTLPSKIAVITAEGNIMQSKSRSLGLLGEEQVTPHKVEQAFKIALSDPNTRAIVLRVASPGGEILPSSEIASLIEQTAKKIPVYISMGDVAASGGYMISAPATRIFSDKLTYTGSIGVFLGKVSLEGLYKKLDIKKEITGRSPVAGIYSESKSWNPQEKIIMTRLLDNYYANFVGFVGEKRKLTPEAAEAAAKGRVWLGSDAKKLKLVDEIGGLRETIEYAAKENSNQDYEIWEIRPAESLLAALGLESPFGSSLGATLLGKEAYQHLNWMANLEEDPFLYYSPVKIY